MKQISSVVKNPDIRMTSSIFSSISSSVNDTASKCYVLDNSNPICNTNTKWWLGTKCQKVCRKYQHPQNIHRNNQTQTGQILSILLWVYTVQSVSYA